MKVYLKVVIAFLATGSVFLAGYGFGVLRTQKELIRACNSSALMFTTGIHDSLVRKDYESAERVAGVAASAYIMSIETAEKHSLLFMYWSLIPWTAQTDVGAVSAHHLNQAFSHFSKHPTALMPEAMAYLKSYASRISHPDAERVGLFTLESAPEFLPKHRTSDTSPLILLPKHADIVIPLPSNSERQ